MKQRPWPILSVNRQSITFALAAIAAIAFAPAPSHAKTPESHYAMVQTTLQKHVIPHFESLHAAAARLPDAVTRVCETGADGAREDLNTAFRDTVFAWAGVEFFRFGPMTEGARRERMSFWPDPRGVMNRQLRQLMASGDAALVENGALAKQSAAVQGLRALEVLLTDTDTPLGPGDAAKFRCTFAAALAANISANADALYQGWSKDGGWKDKMLRPGSDNDTYKEPQEAASELVKALLTGLQLIGDGQVKPRVDGGDKFQGPYAKANLSGGYYEAGVASLGAFYDTLELESFLPEDKDWVKNWAGGAWRTMRESDGAGGRGPGVAKGQQPPVRKVFDMFSGLRKLVAAEMSAAAGLTVGFNELDGD
ncbi:MAG: imelysin family protein [Hyphomicrobium sp.]